MVNQSELGRKVLFKWLCPECHNRLKAISATRQRCEAESLCFEQVDGIWRFLTPPRESRFNSFIREYEIVRHSEGCGSADPGFYRALPFQDRSGRHSRPWRIRAVSFETLIQKVLLQQETLDHCGSRAFKATACPAGKVQDPVSGLAAGSGGSRTLLSGSGAHFSGSGGLWTGSGRSSSLWMSGDRPRCRRSDGNGQRGRDRSVLSKPDSGRSARGDRPV